MDTIKQNKVLIWTVIVLLIGNIVTISAVWLLRTERPTNRITNKRLLTNKSNYTHRNYLTNKLELNQVQTVVYNEFKANHFKSMRALKDSIYQYKQLINTELFNEDPNTILINELSDTIGLLNAKFEKANYEHFLKLKTLLTPEQQTKFKGLMNDASCSPKTHRHRDRNKVK